MRRSAARHIGIVILINYILQSSAAYLSHPCIYRAMCAVSIGSFKT